MGSFDMLIVIAGAFEARSIAENWTHNPSQASRQRKCRSVNNHTEPNPS
jgi:hypothetical protein